MLGYLMDNEYKAAIYLRLSREDGDLSSSSDKTESNSISNQRLLIMSYVKQHPEITVIREFCDDGYSGANFDRPQFQRMMEAVRSGEINCIIVKDLSRFGREYIEAGKYVEKIFPRLGVRFIAINDAYDSAQRENAGNDIILPFKNLINDSYCRDISIKVRTNLEAKRRSGEFVGSRVCYGYMRSPDNRNQLIIDEKAAAVVRDIFRWKIDGYSPTQIAERLNKMGVPSPIEYKRQQGSKQRCPFQKSSAPLWSPVAVYRILGNEIYTGTLIQGRTTTPNHKVRKTITKQPSEWTRTEHAHEAIISPQQFDIVRGLMADDTRRPTGAEHVEIFSGKIFCANCGSPMVRRKVTTGGHTYYYMVCGTHKQDKNACQQQGINESKVYDAVLAVIQSQIALAVDMDNAMRQIEALAWEHREIARIEAAIAAQEEAVQDTKRLKVGLYEDYQNGVITRDEYDFYKAEFDRKLSEVNDAIMRLHSEKNTVAGGFTDRQGWLHQFRQYENITVLDRRTVVYLIDRILIGEDRSVEVQLRNRSQFDAIAQFLADESTEAV